MIEKEEKNNSEEIGSAHLKKSSATEESSNFLAFTGNASHKANPVTSICSWGQILMGQRFAEASLANLGKVPYVRRGCFFMNMMAIKLTQRRLRIFSQKSKEDIQAFSEKFI
ncbi:hypothetical protein AVEN_193619-1 [Araneus ventricosus]|uniref:Uncharacterized protein n=1 Tax=Araneus ventricosus TaxID=182803 RepID=A0A4Y2UT68_ARAVE|nr:hypothetical protein AVEN_193619-1 [Araneus ventricosus]